MEPTDALRSIETVLRNAIRYAYPQQTWLDAKGAPTRESLEAKRTEESRRRDGAVTSLDLLDYADTRHLTAVIEQSWELFKPFFDDPSRTKAYFGVIEDIRNTIAHSRTLVPFEKNLIAGIAGQLSNQVSIYTGSQGSRRYYPTIESLTDNFGVEGAVGYPSTHSGQRLRLDVGETITISGRAVSADSRSIDWFIKRYSSPLDQLGHKIGTGADLSYEYTPSKNDVGEAFSFTIYIASDSEYRRHPSGTTVPVPSDDWRYFTYSVNPPYDRIE